MPFTPVTGPRILLRDTNCKNEVFNIMISALKDLTIKVTFSFAMFYTFAKKCDLESSCEEMCINAHIYIRDFLSEADIFDY